MTIITSRQRSNYCANLPSISGKTRRIHAVKLESSLMDALPSMLSFTERSHCNLKRDYPLQFRRGVSGMLPQHGVQKDHDLRIANGQLTYQTQRRLLKPCLANVELQD